MKPFPLHSSLKPVGCGAARGLAGMALGCVLLLAPTPAWTQSDNFNDGNDTGWTRYDPIGMVAGTSIATFSFPNGAYRIQTSARPPQVPAIAGPPRAGSFRTDVVYQDFYVAVDVVAWDQEVNQAFGLLARLKDHNQGPGQIDGYSLTWGPDPLGVYINRITQEAPTGITSGDATLALSPGRSYRFVFVGKGASLTGRVYELPNLTTPVKEVSATDSTYTEGLVGLFVFDNSNANNIADATFENFLALVTEPPRLSISLNAFGEAEVTWPIDAGPFRLQSSTRIPNATWLEVDPALISTAPPNKIYLEGIGDGGARTKFFRLIQD